MSGFGTPPVIPSQFQIYKCVNLSTSPQQSLCCFIMTFSPKLICGGPQMATPVHKNLGCVFGCCNSPLLTCPISGISRQTGIHWSLWRTGGHQTASLCTCANGHREGGGSPKETPETALLLDIVPLSSSVVAPWCRA